MEEEYLDMSGGFARPANEHGDADVSPRRLFRSPVKPHVQKAVHVQPEYIESPTRMAVADSQSQVSWVLRMIIELLRTDVDLVFSATSLLTNL